MNAAIKLDGVLELLAEAVAERVLARLGSSANTKAVVYTSRKAGTHIPGKSRNWMLNKCKGMPGARKVGRDWTISVQDYEAWATAQDTSRCRSKAPCAKAVLDDEAYADAALAAAGFRVPRTTG